MKFGQYSFVLLCCHVDNHYYTMAYLDDYNFQTGVLFTLIIHTAGKINPGQRQVTKACI